MKTKLNCILLVDDDNDCNYFHKKLLKEMECVETIEVATDGAKALEFLQSANTENHTIPDIIFLDINMPRMNGWDFLESYEKLQSKLKAKIIIIMLTTSLNPDDRARALKLPMINGFKEKYLDESTLNAILREHFSEHF